MLDVLTKLEIEKRIAAGTATNDDAKMLLDEVEHARQQQSQILDALTKVHGLATTTYHATTESLSVLLNAAEQVALSLRVAKATDESSSSRQVGERGQHTQAQVEGDL
jgi:hypothetical protein